MNNQKELNDFLNYIVVIKGNSVRTKNEYRYDLALFLRYLKIMKQGLNIEKINNISIEDLSIGFIREIKLEDIYDFLSYCQFERNNGSHTRSRKIAALKSFFNYLTTKKKYFKENPTAELESPKIGKRNPVYLSLDEAKQLYSGLNKLHYYRNFCILTIFLNSGIRLSELANINLSSIKENKLSLIGKGNKERIVYLNSSCLKAIHNYVEFERYKMQNADNEKALFLSQKGNRLSTRSIQRVVKNANIKSKLYKKKLSPHKLRHTIATLLYRNGVDLLSLQKLLGHSSVSTTQVYTHIDSKILENIVENNPLNKITHGL